MKDFQSLLSLTAFVVTWLLVRRLLGETTFHASGAMAMLVAFISTVVTTHGIRKRKTRLAS